METKQRLEKAYLDYNNLLKELEKNKETYPNNAKIFPIANVSSDSFEHKLLQELGYLESYIFGLETVARLEKTVDTGSVI